MKPQKHAQRDLAELVQDRKESNNARTSTGPGLVNRHARGTTPLPWIQMVEGMRAPVATAGHRLPGTRNEVVGARRTVIDSLLLQYGLLDTGDIHERRRRLLDFLGVPQDHSKQ